MGLLSLIKRISKGAYGNPANRLTNAEVDNNWQQIIDLFPTPASGNTDVGKTVVLNSAKTGFDYVALPNGGVQSVVGGDNVTVDNTDPENPIINSSGVQSIVAGTNITVDNTDPENPIVTASFTQQGKYLISGGVSWSGTGLVYDVSTLEYFFNGNKTSTATQVTLGASDPSNNRFDVVVVNEAGVVSVIQGTASVNPITPPIPEEQLLVQYILVEAGLASPSVSNENIYLDDPAGSWTLSTYTTGAPTGTLVFNGTTSPKEGINHIQANADQRLGARFVRATSFDAFQYTVLQVWVRFTGSNVATNKSLNVRFENSAGVLVGNTLNLFNYGIQRNILNTWQLAVIPITAFGSLPSTVKGFRAIMIGGTVGVTRQWDMDWIHLSDTSVPNTEVPKINFYKDDNVVGSQSGLNLKAGTNIGITAVNDVINNRVEYVVDALGGGGGAISALTPATATNTMDNGNYQQNWNWNNLGGGIGLKLSTSSTSRLNGSSVLDVRTSGTLSISGQTTYAARFISSSINPVSGVSSAIYCEGGANPLGYGAAIQTGGNAFGYFGGGDLNLGGGSGTRIYFNNGGGEHQIITKGTTEWQFLTGAGRSLWFLKDDMAFFSSDGRDKAVVGFWNTSTTRNTLGIGRDKYGFMNAAGYAQLDQQSGKLIISANNDNLSAKEQLTIYGNNNNVGIGTTTPNVSAKLDVSSTTQGFAPPEMTATQASAITTTSRRIIIYVTDTNGTFTSAGLWFWNGTIWKLIIAE